jgi:hypothetical protein
LRGPDQLELTADEKELIDSFKYNCEIKIAPADCPNMVTWHHELSSAYNPPPLTITHLTWISPERPDVLLDPIKGFDDISQAEVCSIISGRFLPVPILQSAQDNEEGRDRLTGNRRFRDGS